MNLLTTETNWPISFLSVVETSPEYEEFLGLIGEKVRLQGWKNYAAGLDVESKSLHTRCNSVCIFDTYLFSIHTNQRIKQGFIVYTQHGTALR